jgi:hypothetical protein
MSLNRSAILRLALVAAALTSVASVPAAQADSTLVVTRSGGTGADIALTEGTWKFTVTAVSGKPAQVIVRIESADGTRIAFASDHPRVGQTFESYQIPAAGPNRLRAKLFGGPVGENDSVTIEVDTP